MSAHRTPYAADGESPPPPHSYPPSVMTDKPGSASNSVVNSSDDDPEKKGHGSQEVQVSAGAELRESPAAAALVVVPACSHD